MIPEAFPWTISALALSAALLLGLRLRARSAEAEALASQLAGLDKRLAETAKQLETREKSRQKRGGELDELRHKLDKVKRRAQRVQGEQRDEHTRIVELKEELRLAQGERRAAIEELERLRASVDRDPQPTSKRAPEKLAPVKPPEPAPPPPESEALKRLSEERAAVELRAEKLATELAKARAEATRQRRRVNTLDTAYTALRGELEAKKDRLRTQQEELERLRAMRVTFAAEVSDPAPEDEPPIDAPEGAATSA